MKKMTASQQKILKAIHLLVAGVWLACVVVLTGLSLISGREMSGDELYMFNFIYHFVDMDILTPAAIGTLLTGVVYSTFTKWGFFKHGWVIYKWVVTLGIISVGTFYLGPMVERMLEISDVQRIASLSDSYYLNGAKVGFRAGVINTALLVVAVVFSVFKPWKHLGK